MGDQTSTDQEGTKLTVAGEMSELGMIDGIADAHDQANQIQQQLVAESLAGSMDSREEIVSNLEDIIDIHREVIEGLASDQGPTSFDP